MKVNSSFQKQSGATLIVCLVILAVMTVLGLSSISSSNLELKMSASQRDHSVAFQKAEAALKAIERERLSQIQLYDQVIPNRCAANETCFTSTCNHGMCFAGTYTGDSPEECSLANENGVVPQFWQIENNWQNARKRPVPRVDGSTADTMVQYLVEFMCFVARDDAKVTDEDATVEMLPLYRVTVRAEGEANRASVMLQSVFRGAALKTRGGAL